MNRPTLGLIIGLIPAFIMMTSSAHAATLPKFAVQASYVNAVLKALNFDYSQAARQNPPGFTADGKHIANSACYAKFSGEDNDTITDYLNALKDKQAYAQIVDTRKRMQEAVARQKLEIWQEVLCVAGGKEEVPYLETGSGSKGKWDATTISIDGVRKGSWKEVFTVARRRHLYSITVTPPKQSSPP